MHTMKTRSVLSALFLGSSAVLLLAGCTTRTLMLTNTSAEPLTLSSTGTSDGWDCSRTIAPGESFEMRVPANYPIDLPGMTVQVR